MVAELPASAKVVHAMFNKLKHEVASSNATRDPETSVPSPRPDPSTTTLCKDQEPASTAAARTEMAAPARTEADVEAPKLKLFLNHADRAQRKVWEVKDATWWIGMNRLLMEPVEGAEYTQVDPYEHCDFQTFIYPGDFDPRPTHVVVPDGFNLGLAVPAESEDKRTGTEGAGDGDGAGGVDAGGGVSPVWDE